MNNKYDYNTRLIHVFVCIGIFVCFGSSCSYVARVFDGRWSFGGGRRVLRIPKIVDRIFYFGFRIVSENIALMVSSLLRVTASHAVSRRVFTICAGAYIYTCILQLRQTRKKR